MSKKVQAAKLSGGGKALLIGLFVVAIGLVSFVFLIPVVQALITGGDDVGDGSKVTLTLVAIPTEGGRVTPSGKTVWDIGSKVTIKAEPNAGYVFVRWEKNGVNYATQAQIQITVDATATYAAVFKLEGTGEPPPGNLAFQVTNKPTTITLTQGGFVTGRIDVSRLSGEGAITSQVITAPGGLSVSVGPTSLGLSASQTTGSFTAIIGDNGNAPVGTYSITIRLTSTQQNTDVTFNVSVQQAFGTVRVVVLLNGNLLSGVDVKVKSLSGQIVKQGVTEVGVVTFTGVPTGSYVVEVTKDTFRSLQSVTVHADRVSDVTVSWSSSAGMGSIEVRLYFNGALYYGTIEVFKLDGHLAAWTFGSTLTANLPAETYRVKGSANFAGSTYTQETQAEVIIGQRTFVDLWIIKQPGEYSGLSLLGGTVGITVTAGIILALVVAVYVASQYGFIGKRRR